ncbi:MAG: DUF1599 domain-containing protein, partial [Bacteroidia bacterium]|nr:DUF1599 domain-containing protein [Bacteroidia bacterium]
DQIFIKLKRIRTVEQKGERRVGDDVETEWVGVANYCVMALMLVGAGADDDIFAQAQAVPNFQVLGAEYDRVVAEIKRVLRDKNHDYDEAWRDMHPHSYTDLALVKILRVKAIEARGGQTLVSEGVEPNFRDIFNYAMFALIRLEEGRSNPETASASGLAEWLGVS